MNKIRIATRQSPLAMWQAHYVKQLLEKQNDELEVELIPFMTKGDIILDTPLAKVGGKGLFVKELELALLNNEADIAVHSMKDVPSEFPEGLTLATICERDNPFDAFVSNKFGTIADIPKGGVIGTSSLRRQAQIRNARPDIVIRDLRGNVGTRLNKLDEGQYDAIILATAGLNRLGLQERIKHTLEPTLSLPAVGQGAVGIECRENDDKTLSYLKGLNHLKTSICVTAERSFNHHLEGGCQVPIACYAIIENEQLHIEGLVASLDGSIILKDKVIGSCENAKELGIELAKKLILRGAKDILDGIYSVK